MRPDLPNVPITQETRFMVGGAAHLTLQSAQEAQMRMQLAKWLLENTQLDWYEPNVDAVVDQLLLYFDITPKED